MRLSDKAIICGLVAGIALVGCDSDTPTASQTDEQAVAQESVAVEAEPDEVGQDEPADGNEPPSQHDDDEKTAAPRLVVEQEDEQPLSASEYFSFVLSEGGHQFVVLETSAPRDLKIDELERISDSSTTAALKPEAMEETWERLQGHSFDLYDAEQMACRATVTDVLALSRDHGNAYESAGLTQPSAEKIWRLGSRSVVAVVEPQDGTDCADAFWARGANASTPVFWDTFELSEEQKSAVTRALREAPVYEELGTDRQWHIEQHGEEHAREDPWLNMEFAGFRHPTTDQEMVFVNTMETWIDPGGGGYNPGGDSWSIFVIESDGTVRIHHPESARAYRTLKPTVAVELDKGDEPVFVSDRDQRTRADREVVEVKDGSYDLVDSTPLALPPDN